MAMADLLFIALVAGFGLLSIGFIKLSENLMENEE
jgi:hypothetical protein